MNQKGYIFILVFMAAITVTQNSIALPGDKGINAKRKADFDMGWRFHLGDVPAAKEINFADNSWRQLNLPHDWSIEGEFSKDNPAGVGGGALPAGVGWYRKTFTLPESNNNKCVFIDFDGVYMNSDVWINGHFLGNRPYGYSSFRYEMTPYLNYGNKPNVIAVRVDNSKQPNSRWYSGSGIYRNVWLVTVDKVHVDHWGTFVSTLTVDKSKAIIKVQTTIRNEMSNSSVVTLRTILQDKNGKEVASSSAKESINGGSSKTYSQQLKITNPKLWSTDNPVLYKAVSVVEANGKASDNYTTPFGIRYFHFDSKEGFFLNGNHVLIKGVCDHHDLGCLGAAINERALQRQLQILKEMGCNAIRTSHNPPAPELLQLADQMGIMIMDEAFDCWKKGKNKYDYHLYWDEWHKRDLSDFILRDRNHPSVIIWSIGNEIPDQWDSAGASISRELAEIVRSLDTSRPITAAMNDPEAKNNSLSHSGVMDLIGHNYRHEHYDDFFKNFPAGKFIATETTSALETRGEYNMPSDSIFIWPRKGVKMNANFTCSAYDNCRVPWGSTHEATLKAVMQNDFVSGMFVWTGFDYLGEPTPYGWPARSSYFGIIDLAGFPKDAYYLYKSVWTDTPVLHILPDWNGWKVGDSVDVWAYYNNADKVELFLNGKSLGTKQKEADDMHIVWRVPYQPGTLRAVSYKNGKVVLTKEIHTAGKVAKMVLEPDRNKISADDKDLSFVTVKLEDANGNLVPRANNLINFKVTGVGSLVGVDNGSETNHESFKANAHTVFNGLCLAVVQSGDKKGKITITATSEGLAPVSTIINTEEIK
jgi:beta-galactosidase